MITDRALLKLSIIGAAAAGGFLAPEIARVIASHSSYREWHVTTGSNNYTLAGQSIHSRYFDRLPGGDAYDRGQGHSWSYLSGAPANISSIMAHVRSWNGDPQNMSGS